VHPANSAAAALSDVVKRFGASVALDGVSLAIERGKVMNPLTRPALVGAPLQAVGPSRNIVEAPAQGRVSTFAIFLMEARMECLRLARSPSFAVPIIMFPLMFYALFGLVLGGHGHASDPGAARHMLATFIAFGCVAPGLFGIGITVAMDRDRGLLELKRALPMPPGTYLAAKLVTAMAFAAAVSILLMLLGAIVGKVVLELAQWAGLFVLSVLGVIPFGGLGLMVGSLVKGQAAPAVLNLIYVPMSFLSGLWVPLTVLPHWLAQVAPIWPAFHLERLAQYVVGEGGELLPHILDLAGLGVLFFAVARRALRKVR
jgi:ABC-2 type transport system permease protein